MHELQRRMTTVGNRPFANHQTCSDLDFYLEEKHRDLTVRRRNPDIEMGRLVDWVEAKMCHSDGLTRSLTGYSRRMNEYRDHMKVDAEKQESGVLSMPDGDPSAILTSLLFVLHHHKPPRRAKYRHNRRGHSSEAIEMEARRHVAEVIAPHIHRGIVEEFSVELDENSRLLVVCMRRI